MKKASKSKPLRVTNEMIMRALFRLDRKLEEVTALHSDAEIAESYFDQMYGPGNWIVVKGRSKFSGETP